MVLSLQSRWCTFLLCRGCRCAQVILVLAHLYEVVLAVGDLNHLVVLLVHDLQDSLVYACYHLGKN